VIGESRGRCYSEHAVHATSTSADDSEHPIPRSTTSTMGMQARSVGGRSHLGDEEKLVDRSVDNAIDESKLPRKRDRVSRTLVIHSLIALCCLGYLLNANTSSAFLEGFPFPKPAPSSTPSFIKEGIKQCKVISRPPPSPKAYTDKRQTSERYVKGTKATLLRNATLWTGEKGGTEVIHGADVLLDGGVVRKISRGDKSVDWRELVKGEVEEVELGGAWVTPGK
jgi:hypothetical protein